MSNFSDGWTYGSIGDIAKVVSGYAFPSSDFHDRQHEGIPVIRMSDIQESGLNLNTAKRVSKISQSIADKFKICPGDLLFGMSGSIEKSILVNHSCEALLNQRVGALRSHQDNGNFHAFVFQSDIVKNQILDLAAGGAQLNISAKQVESIQIPIPPLPEQKRIAKILSRIDNQVDLIESQVKKQAMAGTALAKQLLSSYNGDFLPLSEVTTNYDSQRVPIKSIDREGRSGPYRYFGASGVIDMIDDYLFDGEFILVGEDGANIIDRNKPLAFRVAGKFWVNNHAHVIQPNNLCDLSYLTHYLESLDYTGIASGSAQPKITRTSLDSIQIPIPPIEDQRKIGAAIDSAFNLVKKLDCKKHKLLSIKSAISSDLLSGRKRVSV